MAVITIPKETAEVGGNLFDLVYNGSVLNSEVKDIIAGTNRIIDDTQASPSQKLIIDESGILEILAEGGEIEDYLFGIRQPSASATLDVPEGVPLRLFILGDVRNFSEWYSNNADVWLNEVSDEIIYYNNPNPSGGPILTASEAEIIRQLDPNADEPDIPETPHTYSFLTVAEVQAIVLDPNWVKL